METLAPAIQRLIRSRVTKYGRDNIPCSGLYGDERDARYSDLSKELSALIFKTINDEEYKFRWRQQVRMWRHPGLNKRASEDDDWVVEPEDEEHFAKQKDIDLKRVAFEAEMQSDVTFAATSKKESCLLVVIIAGG